MEWQSRNIKPALDAHFDEGYRNGFEDAKDYVRLALEASFRDARENTRIRQRPEVQGHGIPEDCLNAVESYLLGEKDYAGHLQLLLMDGFYDAREGNWQGEPQEEE